MDKTAEAERIISSLYESLQKLTGLHRQLMDTVRMEREALVAADIPRIEEATVRQAGVDRSDSHRRSERLKRVWRACIMLKKPVRELTLPKLIILVQGSESEASGTTSHRLQRAHSLIKRIDEQNRENQKLVQKSLAHIQEMKKNILGETVPKSSTYTAKGQKSGGMQRRPTD